ncbi:MAG: tyrosine--tRNA ligase [Oscillospiraceae bacterium]|nr:tyrosine--tRNA ligase [Oscillospiraceae bacterium]
MNNEVFSTLTERGYIYQSTDFDGIKKALTSSKSITFYLGIDPTADSLHIGHFFALMMFRYLQNAGHRGVLVIGGATALIGDPSGKSDMRKMLTEEQVKKNLQEVISLVGRFICVDGNNPAIIKNNADWINSQSYVDFMRCVGVHFNVNTMLQADAYANRLKSGGLTFLEMGYMLMQAYDFVYLKKQCDCILQIGGSDQWGNIVAGTTLYRKMKHLSKDEDKSNIYGLTCPLLLTKDGKKMGKTEQGTLWVARDKTIPYDFYQYFYNVDDENVEMLLKLFTKLDLNEISSMCKSDILLSKKTMAYEITSLVHGKKEADKVVDATNTLFGSKTNTENLPFVEISLADLKDGMLLIDLMYLVDFLPSKSEGRRMIIQNAISLDDEKIFDINTIVSKKEFEKGYVIVKRGKKNFLKIIAKK